MDDPFAGVNVLQLLAPALGFPLLALGLAAYRRAPRVWLSVVEAVPMGFAIGLVVQLQRVVMVDVAFGLVVLLALTFTSAPTRPKVS